MSYKRHRNTIFGLAGLMIFIRILLFACIFGCFYWLFTGINKQLDQEDSTLLKELGKTMVYVDPS